jgi:tetratricopeptide (TPR) repeat protein
MLKDLFELFKGASPKGQLDVELADLDRQAASATPDFAALIYNRAGDMCVRANDARRALRYYGRAIDAFLEVGYYDSAAALCRRVIEISPNVVRARATLAFLSLGEGLQYLPFQGSVEENARRSILDYLSAARKGGVEDLVGRRLKLMADVTDNQHVRELIGEFLLEVGEPQAADEVLGSVYAERNRLREPPSEDQRRRWARALRTSVVGAPDRQAAAPAGARREASQASAGSTPAPG